MIRTVLAPNPSALTLDGTRTYLVGRDRVVVVDPGPLVPGHIDAIAGEIGGGVVVSVLITHSHPDHAAGAAELARRFCAPILSAEGGTLTDGLRIGTDAGELTAIHTPGHTPDHFVFHLPALGAVFVGDLMLGGLETTLVSVDEGGDLGAYLASLERVRRLGARVLYPGHGEPFTDPAASIEQYLEHRQEREAQVLDALDRGARTLDELVDRVYGPDLSGRLRSAARGAVQAYIAHIDSKKRPSHPGEG